jgi:hypothetical protein
MTVWIVVESMFGNTRAIADEMSEALGGRLTVEVWNVALVPDRIPADVELLIVGGPTHVFGMSRASTRRDAVKRGAAGAPGKGVREWLDAALDIPADLLATAFDTRIKKAGVPGSAARAISRRLHKAGCEIVLPPQSFYVADTAGPLQAGEAERAREFASQILKELGRRARLSPSA